MNTKALLLAAAVISAPCAWAQEVNPRNPTDTPALNTMAIDQGPPTATDYQFKRPTDTKNRNELRSAARFEPALTTYGASGATGSTGGGTATYPGDTLDNARQPATPGATRDLPVQPDVERPDNELRPERY
ncbi:hypothetical protein [Pseudoduganella namucuonensis]|uniref:Uncharacterized protein n=1 Tax=Pseudoduganella namucuonensis TaxID=1035707 RepID=A0A1I7IK99_9BURK|nr:hypothetical protein [Pseudoduganella namucuonensis]SFU73367.1 hypothetical protein SAMN05216552_100897 [Pseudoduganella namucuonensis]